MILMVDNYDSFTYNVVQLVNRFERATRLVRNDAISVEEIIELEPRAILLLPGPGAPSTAGVTLSIIRQLSGRIPILGICLGMQAIVEAFGGRVVRAKVAVHGKASTLSHRGEGLFSGLPSQFPVGRYHSLTAERATFPAELKIDAETEDGVIMALSHSHLPVYGLQFHPESVLTSYRELLMHRFLSIVEREKTQ